MKRERRKHKNNLMKYLKEADFTQASFSRLLNLSRKTMSDYCVGKILPSGEVARKISLELGISILDIWPDYKPNK